MAASSVRFSPSCTSLLLVLAIAAGSLFHPARSGDADDQLLQGINGYRASLNLSSLAENQNAACLADQMALQFKDQDCTNTTGADAVPGTEQQLPNYLDLLAHCHLDSTVTQDGEILPACVPGLVPTIVLSNFTKSQYNEFLNDSRYVGAGVASEGNWIVVVLSTNTTGGSFMTVQGGSSIPKSSIPYYLLLVFLALWF